MLYVWWELWSRMNHGAAVLMLWELTSLLTQPTLDLLPLDSAQTASALLFFCFLSHCLRSSFCHMLA